MTHLNHEMEQCIQNCLDCHHICYETALNHCLDRGGKHTEPGHFRLMLNCAEICQTSANFMLSGSKWHQLTCSVCAQICEACAQDCETVGDMDSCVEACRKCASSCREMASMAG